MLTGPVHWTESNPYCIDQFPNLVTLTWQIFCSNSTILKETLVCVRVRPLTWLQYSSGNTSSVTFYRKSSSRNVVSHYENLTTFFFSRIFFSILNTRKCSFKWGNVLDPHTSPPGKNTRLPPTRLWPSRLVVYCESTQWEVKRRYTYTSSL